MKKEEKTQRTKERILAAAIVEFGTKSYDSASINTICAESQVSKGLLYHNFKGKDDLYLQCVALCYQEMLDYIQQRDTGPGDFDIPKWLAIRQSFFAEHPHYSNIFFNTVLQPPKHLIGQIHAIRKDFDAYYQQHLKTFLCRLPLRGGITTETALSCFLIFSEMYNGYFQNKALDTEDYKTLIDAHEGKMAQLFDILLYGLARQPETNPHDPE